MIGLYYPYIHFRDENWLKYALLQCNKIARIVPEDFRTQDSDDVRRVQGELGAVINSPPYSAGWETASDFIELIRQHAPRLRAKFGVRHIDKWPLDRHTREHAPDGTDPRVSFIFHEKLGHQLVDALQGEGLGIYGEGRGPTFDPRWVGVHRQIAGVFMTSMAEAIAVNSGFDLLSDDVTSHLVVGTHSVERLAEMLLGDEFGPRKKNLVSRSIVAELALRTVLPRDLSAIPMSKIIEFRTDYGDELDAFQKWQQGEVKRLKDEAGSITSPLAMSEHMAELEERVKREHKKLQAQLRRVGIVCAASTIAIKIATDFVPEVAATWFDQQALNVAGLAFASIPIAGKSYSDAEKLTAGSPMAYLMHAQERLTPRTLLQKLDTGFRKIATGI